jgi:hypothetical protein
MQSKYVAWETRPLRKLAPFEDYVAICASYEIDGSIHCSVEYLKASARHGEVTSAIENLTRLVEKVKGYVRVVQ